MKEYSKPDFDVTIYKFEDVITASGDPNLEFGTEDPDGGDWWG